MRALLPESVDEVDLHAWYAAGWSERGGLRANFVASVDGGASTNGVSAGLQTPGDNAVFATLRDLADVVLVGAGTARAEGYGPTTFSPRRLAQRRAYGLAPELVTAVVSRSLRLDPTTSLFTEARPGARPIVLSCASADPAARGALERVADVVICGEDEVELQDVRTALEQRGLNRILCEGGPTLFADVVRAGVLDELCLSLTARLAGPGPTRIVAGTPWVGAPDLQLVGLLEEDGALFSRYTARPSA